MDVLLYLIPLALVIGVFWLGFFIWSIKSDQYEDMEGAAHRILMEEDAPSPRPEKVQKTAPPAV